MSEGLLRPYNCPRCGKEFYPTPNHAYRDKRYHGTPYCCWACFNHRYDEEAGYGKPIEMCDICDGKVIKTFSSVAEALLYVDGTPQGLLNAVRNGIGYKRFKWRYKKQ